MGIYTRAGSGFRSLGLQATRIGLVGVLIVSSLAMAQTSAVRAAAHTLTLSQTSGPLGVGLTLEVSGIQTADTARITADGVWIGVMSLDMTTSGTVVWLDASTPVGPNNTVTITVAETKGGTESATYAVTGAVQSGVGSTATPTAASVPASNRYCLNSSNAIIMCPQASATVAPIATNTPGSSSPANQICVNAGGSLVPCTQTTSTSVPNATNTANSSAPTNQYCVNAGGSLVPCQQNAATSTAVAATTTPLASVIPGSINGASVAISPASGPTYTMIHSTLTGFKPGNYWFEYVSYNGLGGTMPVDNGPINGASIPFQIPAYTTAPGIMTITFKEYDGATNQFTGVQASAQYSVTPGNGTTAPIATAISSVTPAGVGTAVSTPVSSSSAQLVLLDSNNNVVTSGPTGMTLKALANNFTNGDTIIFSVQGYVVGAAVVANGQAVVTFQLPPVTSFGASPQVLQIQATDGVTNKIATVPFTIGTTQQTGPSISLYNSAAMAITTGVAGATVNAVASGFANGDVIQFSMSQNAVGSATVANGLAQLTFTIPQHTATSLPDIQLLTGSDANGSFKMAVLPFTYALATPPAQTLTLVSATGATLVSAPAGTNVALVAQGFPNGDVLSFVTNGTTVLGTATVTNGLASYSFPLAQDTRTWMFPIVDIFSVVDTNRNLNADVAFTYGSGVKTLVVADTQFTVRAFVLMKVPSTLGNKVRFAMMQSASAGSAISVTLAGYHVKQHVNLFLNKILLGAVKANSKGIAALRVRLPHRLKAGTYQLRATNVKGRITVIGLVVIASPKAKSTGKI